MASGKPRNVYIVESVRTPIGRGYQNGVLHEMLPVDLLAVALGEVMKRSGVDKGEVEDVITGCVSPVLLQGANIGRFALSKAGFPLHVPSVQLNRMCGSGQQAVHFGYQAIASGEMDTVVACGIEMMSVVPMGSDWFIGKPEYMDYLEKFKKGLGYEIYHQGQSAEMVAEKWNLNKKDIDEFSGKSHEKMHEAVKKGYFDSQIVPVTVEKEDGKKIVVSKDEGLKYPVDYKKLATLKTPFKENGVISAANASQISDGASAVLLMSEDKVKALGLKPKARIVATASVGSDPELMLTGPIPATVKVLKKAKMDLKDIDIFEINEAFASVVLAWQKELGVDPSKVNPNGGAIAHGHPLGATGCVLMTKLAHELQRSGKRYGLQTMCIGFGQATATIIENVNYTPKSKL